MVLHGSLAIQPKHFENRVVPGLNFFYIIFFSNLHYHLILQVKILFVLLSLSMLVTFPSCKKDWTCTCTCTGSCCNPPTGTPTTFTIKAATEGQATSTCNGYVYNLYTCHWSEWSCNI